MENEDEFEECEGAHPDRGYLNPGWTLKALLLSSTSRMRWDALAGLANELYEEDPHELYSSDEIVDILMQSMYTGQYVHPFEHAVDENQITEDEISKFSDWLDYFVKDDYTNDEDND